MASEEGREPSVFKGLDNRALLALIILISLLYLLLPILLPFMLAILLAYLGSPMVKALESRKLPRVLAVSAVFMLIFLLLGGVFLMLIPLVEQQVALFLGKVPEMIAWLKEVVFPWLQQKVSLLSLSDQESLQQVVKDNAATASGLVASVLSSMSASGASLLSGLATVLLIPLLTFYFLRDWESTLDKVRQMLPRATKQTVLMLAEQVDEVLAAFFKGQILVMLCLAIFYTIGLSLIGLEFALLIALIAGLVSFVPYLGVVTGLLLGCLAAFFQLHDVSLIVPVVFVFGLGQLLEGFVLTPILVGDKIGLHPVAVMFAIMAGGQLFGFSGILLALPVAAVLLVFIKFFGQAYQVNEASLTD